jgi:hypothetical protein
MKSIEEIKRELATQTGALEKLRAVKASATERTSRAEKARSLHLTEALLGNAQAKKELDRATAEFDSACRAESDAADAIAQTEAAIARLNVSLGDAEKERLAEDLRTLIWARIAEKREQRILKLVAELENELAELRASNNSITAAARAFDRRVAEATNNFANMQRDPVRIDRGLQGSGPLNRFAASSPAVLASLLDAIDSVVARGEEQHAGQAIAG